MSHIICKNTPEANIVGTGKVGSIKASKAELREIFGAPNRAEYDDGKVTFQWILTFSEDGSDDETVATIYDWKHGWEPTEHEMIEWSIGGRSREAELNVYSFMEGLL